jgi:hypothetical protein
MSKGISLSSITPFAADYQVFLLISTLSVFPVKVIASCSCIPASELRPNYTCPTIVANLNARKLQKLLKREKA